MSDWEEAPDDGGREDAPAPAAKPAELPPATTKDRILAAEGGVNRLTVAGTLGLPVDTVTNIVNLAIAGYETLSPERVKRRELTGEAPTAPIEKLFLGSEHIAEIMDRMGFQTTNPRPDDAASRARYTGAGVAAGLVLDDIHGVRTQTMRRVEELPEKAFTDLHYYRCLDNQPLWEWIAGDSFDHEAEHEAQIRAWRAERGG